MFTIAQKQLVVPKMYVSAHTSTLIKPGQWVIQVSDTDLVLTLLETTSQQPDFKLNYYWKFIVAMVHYQHNRAKVIENDGIM